MAELATSYLDSFLTCAVREAGPDSTTVVESTSSAAVVTLLIFYALNEPGE